MLLNKTDKSELDGLGEILDELFSSGARWAWHETQAKNAKRASIDEPTLDPKRAKQAILDLLLGLRTHPLKSLEQKNKEGRCSLQLLDKIVKLRDYLGAPPTKRQFADYYNWGYLGSIYNTFGSYSEARKIALQGKQ